MRARRAHRRGLLPLVLGVLGGAACDTPATLYDTTRLGNTYDQQGPYLVRAVVGGTATPDAVTLIYHAASLDDVETEMEGVDEVAGVYEGRIPGHPAFTQLSYYVRVRAGEQVATEPADVASGLRFGFWVLGAACADPVDCAPGETCHLPSGACLELGGAVCAADRDCGKGRQCEKGECQLAARQCGVCGLDEVCGPLSDECIARPRCDGGLSCPLDFICERPTELCRRFCTGADQCNRDELCQAGFCRQR